MLVSSNHVLVVGMEYEIHIFFFKGQKLPGRIELQETRRGVKRTGDAGQRCGLSVGLGQVPFEQLRVATRSSLPHLVLQDLEPSTHTQYICIEFHNVLAASQGIIS